MIHLAVHYNNLGVDILSSKHQEKSHDREIDKTKANERFGIHRNQLSGKGHRKRRKLVTCNSPDVQALNKAQKEADTEQRVNNALAYFQKALSLIVHTTEHHHYHGNGLKYHPDDADGFLRYDNEVIGKQLVGSINPHDTKIDLMGDKGYSNEFIYWKAIKIGENNGNNNDDLKVEAEDDDSACFSDEFTRSLNEPDSQQQQQQRHQQQQRTLDSQCESNGPHQYRCHQNPQHTHAQHHNHEQQQALNTGGYESLSKSIFHSMICIYNIALCYQYKGMTIKAKQLVASASYRAWDFRALGAASQFFLNAAVDHYTRAYELMTRFRLEGGTQYTLLMAMMNNLAATYGSLYEHKKAEICNRYLVRSLILIICSSERDGHMGQEVLSRNTDEDNKGGILSRAEDRSTFESFLSNVTYLMMDDDEQYMGDKTAAAA